MERIHGRPKAKRRKKQRAGRKGSKLELHRRKYGKSKKSKKKR